jgi:protein phosphatase methylesterase 1
MGLFRPRLPTSNAGEPQPATCIAPTAPPAHATCLPGAEPAATAAAGAPEEAAPPPPPLPTPWSTYFDACRCVRCPTRGINFNVYLAGDSGPVVLCLHGAGYTGLTWALAAQRLRGSCRVMALDLRGHGGTRCDGGAAAEADLSAPTLAADVTAAWVALYEGESPATVVVGHSMGGAIAVHCAVLPPLSHSVQGVVVIDVVEGTALTSLKHAIGVLRRRPAGFPSLDAAANWALSTGACRDVRSAHVSLPSMLVESFEEGSTPEGAAHFGEDVERAEEAGPFSGPTAVQMARLTRLSPRLEPLRGIAEDEDEDEERETQAGKGKMKDGGAVEGAAVEPAPVARPPSPDATVTRTFATGPTLPVQGKPPRCLPRWRWRTPLEQSAPYWEGWYQGLSSAFLSLPISARVLVLAGTDRLDGPLTLAQMQGKFQLVLMPQAGHAIQEDSPEKVGDVIAGAITRFRIGQPLPFAGKKPLSAVGEGG